MTDILSRPLVPVASVEDAESTYEALREYVDADAEIHVVNVIEKAGGAPDKAGVEQRELAAEEAFSLFRDRAAADGLTVETDLLYGTDVAAAIREAAAERSATSIAFRSRGGGRIVDFLSGSVRTKLVTEVDRPVVVLPRDE
ncbi:hypothetical protein GCM10027435_28650 [Haloparvum alkalitolerans]|uniref:universal stress protein n=1 Tax=Haloparvum alkalitolerans TaxID=1042953 RepID=UPI003CE998C8